MQRLIIIPLLLFGFVYSYAQNYVDIQQERIDLIDGVKDQNVAFSSFNYLYFEQVDLLQKILLTSQFESEFIQELNLALFHELYSINQEVLQTQRKGPGYFMTLEKYLLQKREGKGELFLASNLTLAYEILPFIAETDEAYQFILKEAKIHPDQVFLHYGQFANASFSEEILSIAASRDPIGIKTYFNGHHPIHLAMKASQDTMNKLILKTFNDSYRPSWGLSLLHEIANGTLSISKADRLANLEDELYLRHLINLASVKDVMGKISIDKLLNTICTRKVREVNGQYQESSESTRFESIQKYENHELYNFIVYSQEEIFTSSFNGIFKMLLSKQELEGVNAYELLENVNFNEFRTFLKMCASYATLEEFLADMTPAQNALLLRKFISIESQDDYLKEAVSIADALGSIKDSVSISIIEHELYSQYNTTTSKELKIVYALLIQLFADKAVEHKVAFKAIAESIPQSGLNKMDEFTLFGYDNTHSQMHLFYKGKDGESSNASFMSLWRNAKWKITDHGSFVSIKNTSGKAVQIVANKPNHDIFGPQDMLDYFREQNAEIEVLVHRGHSFYVSKSLEYVQAEMQIVLLGSCGGYNQVLNVLNQAPSAQIISTKQIGSHTVNNPLVYKLATEINEGKEIEWETFWDALSNKFSEGTYASNKFNEYVPPHKNLGAAFIQAYRQAVN